MTNFGQLYNDIKPHVEADRLMKGQWLRRADDKDADGFYRGCFYGCLTQSDSDAIENACGRYGIPLWMGYWSEKVFEGLPASEAPTFALAFAKALKDNTFDAETVKHQLAIKRLTHLLTNVKDDTVLSAIKQVIACHEDPDNANWSAAESAAESAAWQRERDWMFEILRGEKSND